MPTRPLTRDRGQLPIEDHGLIGEDPALEINLDGAGDPTPSISDVQAEQGWPIVQPVLDARAADEIPLVDHPAGSDGP